MMTAMNNDNDDKGRTTIKTRADNEDLRTTIITAPPTTAMSNCS